LRKIGSRPAGQKDKKTTAKAASGKNGAAASTASEKKDVVPAPQTAADEWGL
jgi:hypothetical protein